MTAISLRSFEVSYSRLRFYRPKKVPFEKGTLGHGTGPHVLLHFAELKAFLTYVQRDQQRQPPPVLISILGFPTVSSTNWITTIFDRSGRKPYCLDDKSPGAVTADCSLGLRNVVWILPAVSPCTMVSSSGPSCPYWWEPIARPSSWRWIPSPSNRRTFSTGSPYFPVPPTLALRSALHQILMTYCYVEIGQVYLAAPQNREEYSQRRWNNNNNNNLITIDYNGI